MCTVVVFPIPSHDKELLIECMCTSAVFPSPCHDNELLIKCVCTLAVFPSHDNKLLIKYIHVYSGCFPLRIS